ncbi:MAG: hypothetical protein ABIE47_01525 [Pseudomonadota bacterium]
MMIPRGEIVRSLAFIGDTHFFSRYALFPRPYTTSAGQVFNPSPGQTVINRGYESFQKTCNELQVDTVVLTGDILHGQNPIEKGTLLMSPHMDEQEEYAVESLRPLIEQPCQFGDHRRLYGISGSGYHRGGKGHNPEASIIARLGGTFWGALANTTFEPSKKVFRIQHGESAAFIYKEMLLGREAMFTKEAEAQGKIPHVDVIVQGHWHCFMAIEEKGIRMIQVPAWIAFEPSKPYLKSYGKMQGDIGAVIVLIDEKDRLVVWHYLYEKPNIIDFVRKS